MDRTGSDLRVGPNDSDDRALNGLPRIDTQIPHSSRMNRRSNSPARTATAAALAAMEDDAASMPPPPPPKRRSQPNQHTHRKSDSAAAGGSAGTAAAATAAATASPASEQRGRGVKRVREPVSPAAAAAGGDAASASASAASAAASSRPVRAASLPPAPAASPAPKQPLTPRGSKAASATTSPAAAADMRPPPPPTPKPKQRNQYSLPLSGSKGAAATAAGAGKTKPPSSAAAAAATASAEKPKQRNQHSKPLPAAAVAGAGSGKKPQGATAGSGGGSGGAKKPKLPPSSAAAAGAAPRPRHPNQYAIKVVPPGSTAPVVLHPGRVKPKSSAGSDGGQAVQQQRSQQPHATTLSAPPRKQQRQSSSGAAASASASAPAARLIPRVFLTTPMPALLQRLTQILDRDDTSRRQVAAAIGASQSKISRLLHGRSPFRSPEEEEPLRHFVYTAERAFVEQLQSTLRRCTDSKTQVLDFTSLPPPLCTMEPPTDLLLYLHYLLPLSKRAPIDTLVARALGLETVDTAASSSRSSGAHAEDGADAQEGSTSDDGDDASGEGADTQLPPPKRWRKLPTSAAPQSSATPMTREQRAAAAAQRRQHQQQMNEGTEVAASASFSAPLSSSDPSTLTGLGAWDLVSGIALRKRLVSLMSATHTSQTDIGQQLLHTSPATVSLLLRGEFPFSTLGAFLSKLREWGRTTDQLAATKVLSLLGSEHLSIGIGAGPDDAAAQVEVEADTGSEMSWDSTDSRRLLRRGSGIDLSGGHDDRVEDDVMVLKLVEPSEPRRSMAGQGMRHYADLLRSSKQAIAERVAAQRARLDEGTTPGVEQTIPSVALQELAELLSFAQIPVGLPPPSTAAPVPVDASSSESSDSPSALAPAPEPQDLSLFSWAHFTCRFVDRPRLDELLFPWVERWTTPAPPQPATAGVGAGAAAGTAEGVRSGSDDSGSAGAAASSPASSPLKYSAPSPAPTTAGAAAAAAAPSPLWSLSRNEIASAARFHDYLTRACGGRMLHIDPEHTQGATDDAAAAATGRSSESSASASDAAGNDHSAVGPAPASPRDIDFDQPSTPSRAAVDAPVESSPLASRAHSPSPSRIEAAEVEQPEETQQMAEAEDADESMGDAVPQSEAADLAE